MYLKSIAEFLTEAGYAVSIVNPAQISAFWLCRPESHKTDKKDARLIARFCAEPAEPPPPELKDPFAPLSPVATR
jgi:transposase